MAQNKLLAESERLMISFEYADGRIRSSRVYFALGKIDSNLGLQHALPSLQNNNADDI